MAISDNYQFLFSEFLELIRSQRVHRKVFHKLITLLTWTAEVSWLAWFLASSTLTSLSWISGAQNCGRSYSSAFMSLLTLRLKSSLLITKWRLQSSQHFLAVTWNIITEYSCHFLSPTLYWEMRNLLSFSINELSESLKNCSYQRLLAACWWRSFSFQLPTFCLKWVLEIWWVKLILISLHFSWIYVLVCLHHDYIHPELLICNHLDCGCGDSIRQFKAWRSCSSTGSTCYCSNWKENGMMEIFKLTFNKSIAIPTFLDKYFLLNCQVFNPV